MLKTYVVFDLETTGLSDINDSIIEIGALKVVDGKVVDRFMEFLKPEEPISPTITNITGITNEMVANAKPAKDVIDRFMTFCGDHVLIGHNVMFDYKFMKRYAQMFGHSFEKSGIDTLKIARKVLTDLESKSLESLCNYYHIENKAAHRAYHDALATAKVYHYLGHYFEEQYPKVFLPQPLCYKPKKEQLITVNQKNYLRKLSQWHDISVPENIDTMSRSDASKLIEKIVSAQKSGQSY